MDRTIPEVADSVESTGIELIGAACTMNNQRCSRAEFVEYIGKRLGEGRREDARQLDVRTSRIGERTEDVEDRALTDFLARTDGVFHGRVKLGGKHKANANLFNGLCDLLRGEVEVNAEGRKDVRRAAMRRLRTIAML